MTVFYIFNPTHVLNTNLMALFSILHAIEESSRFHMMQYKHSFEIKAKLEHDSDNYQRIGMMFKSFFGGHYNFAKPF